MRRIRCLADDLLREVTAPDVRIEALRFYRTDRFVLGVQWHYGWQASSIPDYQVVLDVFKSACLQRCSVIRKITNRWLAALDKTQPAPPSFIP